jgi:acyl-CoA synthetase (AMP-forming)/AMP-acid ligase II
VATGYWNAPEETARAFGVTLDGVEGRFLRTGDVGAFVDGQLFVTGRRKDLVIVDGVNHHPADIEATAEAAHPAIRPGCCAAVSVDHGGREAVVVLAELSGRARRPEDGVRDVAETVRRAVSARHGLPVHDVVLLPPGNLPFTTSGKLQHYACRTGYAAGAFERNRLRDEVAA